MKWPETEITTFKGLKKAIAPQVISASRSTDIPAFYSEWLIDRLNEGYVKWVNPFNQKSQYVSFEKAKVIVFWSKNPRPLMKFLEVFDEHQIAYYFHFTLNDYENEAFEPGVPPLIERLKTFKDLSNQIGKERVIWRFDPLILTKSLKVNDLLCKLERVGNEINSFTKKLVFSFADISSYKKVTNNLLRVGVEHSDFSKDSMIEAAQGIAKLCNNWGISASTCAEPLDLSQFGVGHNRCIDDELILNITNFDPEICNLFGVNTPIQNNLFEPSHETNRMIKDAGQRADCGCVISKDIGQYNTCPHLCLYCYANTSEKVVKRNMKNLSNKSESILPARKLKG